QLKSMLGRAVANRIARQRACEGRPRPGGSGVVIVAIASLLLAGSAMAATGVWNPTRAWAPLAKLELPQVPRSALAHATARRSRPVRGRVRAVQSGSKRTPSPASSNREDGPTGVVTPHRVNDPLANQGVGRGPESVTGRGPDGPRSPGAPPKVSGNTD